MLVTGTVITDCDDCSVYNPSYWSFTGYDGIHNPWTISSTDLNAHLTYSLPDGVVMPLTATPTGLYWNFNYHYADGTPYVTRWDGSDPYMCFCVWSYAYDPKSGYSDQFLMFYASPFHDLSYYFLDSANPLIGFEHWGVGDMLLGSRVPDPVPLPASLPLFLTGLAGLMFIKRRKQR